MRPFWTPGLDGALGPCPGRDPLPRDTAAGVYVLGLTTSPLRAALRGPAPNADTPKAAWLSDPGQLGHSSALPAGPSVRSLCLGALLSSLPSLASQPKE